MTTARAGAFALGLAILSGIATGSSAAIVLPVRISLSAQEIPARALLENIGKRFHASIAIPADLRGTVTITLHNATLEQALTAVLVPIGYSFTRRDGVIIVAAAPRASVPQLTPPGPAAAVFSLAFIAPERAAAILHGLFPDASIRVDRTSNALIASSSPADAQEIRAVVQSLDVRNPREPTVEAVVLHNNNPDNVAARLSPLYPHARFTVAGKQSLLVRATAPDLVQIKSLIGALDAPPPPPLGGMPSASEAVKLTQARPSDVARAVASTFPRTKVGVAGAAIVLRGAPDDVARAKALIAQLDVPPYDALVTQVYRLRTIDAGSVGDLIARTYPDARVAVDKDLNALSVTAPNVEQGRIADAIARLDGPPTQPGYGPGLPGAQSAGGSNFEIVTLRSAIPTQGQGGGGGELTSPIIQTLQQLVPGVRASALSTPGQIALIGDPISLRIAKDFLAKTDILPPLVVLDTEVLEIDESVARNIGLLLSQPVISTTFSEVPPVPDPTTGQSRLIGLSAVTRTPLSLGAQLNLQIQRGTARVLADPRITTLSGRTATIRAGDTISILTTVGGGVGTYTTTQLQNFQTGVTLDITPLVTADNEVTVALHPIVNSLSGLVNGVPQISTRDTQTTVHLKNNQTLVIGGLIQEDVTRTENKVPLLGDLPLIGGVFRNSQLNSTRNELIIVVTPHVLVDGEVVPVQGPPLPSIPTPRPLPTLPPSMQLPEPSGRVPMPQRSRAARPPIAASPAPQRLVASPSPTPIATATNGSGGAVTYGQVPPSIVAGPGDAVNIFYAAIEPAMLTDGAQIRVRAVTTTNAARASLTIGAFSTTLQATGPGHWATTFPFSRTSVLGQPSPQVVLTAYKADGTSASISLQVAIDSS
jgi:type II secretory pathway component GspD/PulD (secretin)